ncbi:response regulator [Methylobacter sp. YRD-M1]|uniref:response regulator n=1 Tax=Methylobacter sp. YRD-M1 TaxID=2911520 RepID=UPI00227A8C60|nr:response regulator [Methylobacter sp. YRD-M1]WAK03237.1 response regulator [Methylobacter sp. YRD-M1]
MIEHSWLSTKEAAQLLDVSQRTIQNWVDTGKLKSTKTLGGHRRLMRSDVEGFLVLRESAMPAEPPAASELRVLIVEDDRTLLRLYELKFGEFNVPHRLFLAANGYQGLLLAGKHCPHLVIADLNMPEMNGLQLIQEIRKTTDMKDSKIIVATGLKAVDIMKMGTLPEDIMILPKPIPFQTLETILYQQSHARLDCAKASKNDISNSERLQAYDVCGEQNRPPVPIRIRTMAKPFF